MAMGTRGLRDVKTEDLRHMLRKLHRGELPCPLEPVGLTVAGLFQLIDQVEVLRGLDAPAVRAVLVSVLAERRA